MSLNGVNGYSKLDAYSAYQTTSTKKAEDTTAEKKESAAEETGVVYEPSASAQKYTQNAELVKKLMADQDAYKSKLMNYVQDMLTGQGTTIGKADDMWKFLASGNYTVTAAAKEEAQKALEDGGYWSVDATSDRIIEMAKALTGGDPSKVEEMRSAIEKGFKEATKSWGKELPEISSKTYDAIMEKLDAWSSEANSI